MIYYLNLGFKKLKKNSKKLITEFWSTRGRCSSHLGDAFPNILFLNLKAGRGFAPLPAYYRFFPFLTMSQCVRHYVSRTLVLRDYYGAATSVVAEVTQKSIVQSGENTITSPRTGSRVVAAEVVLIGW